MWGFESLLGNDWLMNGSVNGKWPLRLSVRTKDSQSLKRGSIPLGANTGEISPCSTGAFLLFEILRDIRDVVAGPARSRFRPVGEIVPINAGARQICDMRSGSSRRDK